MMRGGEVSRCLGGEIKKSRKYKHTNNFLFVGCKFVYYLFTLLLCYSLYIIFRPSNCDRIILFFPFPETSSSGTIRAIDYLFIYF